MADTIPAIARLDYLDRVIRVLHVQAVPTVEAARLAIGRTVEELALRGEARQTRDWRNPVAYRDPTVDCLRELIRWGLVEPAKLADTADAFLEIRQQPIRLTAEGRRFAQLPAPERRELTGAYLLNTHPVFRRFIAMLQQFDVLLPELTDAEIKRLFPRVEEAAHDQDAWMKTARVCERTLGKRGRLRVGPVPTRTLVGDAIGKYLRKRFGARPPKKVKELTGAVNKAIAHAFLRELGFEGDWNAYDRCLRWARDLFLANDGRHVVGMPGWVAWATAEVKEVDGHWSFGRRGYSAHRREVESAIVAAYEELRASARTSLLPIYKIRETAGFYARVSDAVVDRVLGEMATERQADRPIDVRLHFADLKEFVPSAKPFRLDGRKYFYVSLANRPVPNEA